MIEWDDGGSHVRRGPGSTSSTTCAKRVAVESYLELIVEESHEELLVEKSYYKLLRAAGVRPADLEFLP